MSLAQYLLCTLLALSGTTVLYMGLAPIVRRRLVRDRLTGLKQSKADRSAGDTPPLGERLGLRLLSSTGLYHGMERLTRGAGVFSRAAPYRLASSAAGAALLLGALAFAWCLLTHADAWRTTVLPLFGVLAGGLLPLAGMSGRRAQRLRQINRELPFVLDVLVIILRSGNSLEQCFRQLPGLGPMSFPETYRTVEILIAEIETGKPYPEAFERWARLLYVPAGQSLATLFTQALIHGTAIVPSLEQLTTSLIEERSQEARRAAGSRLPALTTIMLLFLLPPMLVIIALPAASQLMSVMEGL